MTGRLINCQGAILSSLAFFVSTAGRYSRGKSLTVCPSGDLLEGFGGTLHGPQDSMKLVLLMSRSYDFKKAFLISEPALGISELAGLTIKKRRGTMGRIMLAWLVLFCVGMVWTSQGEAAPKPNAVILFEHQDYSGDHRAFDLPPGLRYKVVNSLGSFNDKASSVMTGKNVTAVLFRNAKLGGRFCYVKDRCPDLKEERFGKKDSKGRGVLSFNDRVSSLLIIPRGMQWMEYGAGQNMFPYSGMSRFFPLPEQPTKHMANYPWVGDDINDYSHYIWVGSKVRTVLYEHRNFKGKKLRFPTASLKQRYNLGNHGFYRKLSSLRVISREIDISRKEGEGERSPGLPSPGQFVTEEPPPTPVPAPNILQVSGRWKSRKSRNIFQITQVGTNLSLLHGGNNIGSGNITGNSPSSFTLHLKIHKGPHQGTTLKGKPAVEKGNLATRILWQPGNVIWDRLHN